LREKIKREGEKRIWKEREKEKRRRRRKEQGWRGRFSVLLLFFFNVVTSLLT